MGVGAEAARILRRFFESRVPKELEGTRKQAHGQRGITFMRVPERAELLRLTQAIVDVVTWVHRLESLWRTFPI